MTNSLTALSQIIWNSNTHFDDGQIHNYVGQTIHVMDNITITHSTTVDVEDCQILLDDNVSITVQNKGTFKCVTDASDFYALNTGSTWDGIYVTDDKSYLIFTQHCTFKDAANAIVSDNGGVFEIYNGCVFDRNEYSLTVKNYNGDHQGVFYGNTINGNSGGNTPYIGINIENVVATTPGYMLHIGDPSQVIEINNQSALAVQINNSDVFLENTAIDIVSGSYGMHIFGSGSSSSLRNIKLDNLTISTTGTWDYNRYGIWILNGYNLDADNLSLYNILGNNYMMCANSYGDINITNSSFTNPIANNVVLGIKISGTHNSVNIDHQNYFYFQNDNCIGIGTASGLITVSNNNFTCYSGIGVSCSQTNNVTIDNNTFDYASSGDAISITHSTNCNIYNNTITNSSSATSGTGILIDDYCNTIHLYDNEINYGQNGIFVKNYCSEVEVGPHNHVNNITDYGIVSNLFCSDVNIHDNSVSSISPIVGIYCSETDNFIISSNNIDINYSSYNLKVGISVNNAHGENSIINNLLDLNNYVNNFESQSLGLYLENSPNTDIKSNDIKHTGHAITFRNDNSNGIIACNSMDYMYHGIELDNAIWGEATDSYPVLMEIGHVNKPYDNHWHNLVVNNAKVYGMITSYTHYFYFKNVVNYTLWGGEFIVNGYPFYSNNTPNSNYCGNVPPPNIPLFLLPKIAKDNYRKKHIGFVIDSSAASQTNNLSNNNPQGIYSNLLRYNLIRNAYYHLKDNLALVYLGLPSDAKYISFLQLINASNIGVQYQLDNALKSGNYQVAKQILQSYNPHNLSEINTYGTYQKFIQYLEKDSLSSQDSTFLYNIALQNTSTGGQEVYIARNILGLYILDPVINIQASQARKAKNNNTALNSKTNNYIKAYPNPTSGLYSIELYGDYDSNPIYTIYDISGRKILTGILLTKSLNTINLLNLNKGVYYIKVNSSNQTIYKDKIIIIK